MIDRSNLEDILISRYRECYLILPTLDSGTLGQEIATREHVETQYLAGIGSL